MKWNGKNYRPLVPQKIKFQEEKFDVEEYLKSLAEKHDRVPVWRSVIGVNVPVEEPIPPTPSITPSNTPTPSITASPTVTPTASVTPQPTTTPTNTSTPTGTPVLSPTPTESPLPLGYAEADLYLEAVIQAGGDFGASGSTVSGATRTFFNTIWTNGWNTLIKAMYPMLGGVANSHAINAISPGTHDITWYGTITHNSVGVTGDGTTGYGDCNFITNSIPINLYSMTFYSRTNSQRDEALAGATKDGDLYTFNPRGSVADFGRTFGSLRTGVANIITPALGNSSGAVAITRPSTAVMYSVRNGTQVGSFSQGLGSSLANINMYLLAVNNNGTAVAPSNRNISFASFGNLGGLTTQNNFQNELITYQTALARNV